jgi:long-subunit fatty acid transport protein
MVRGRINGIGALIVGLTGWGLQAQSVALPASDPVGLARGGAGVAFGRSLEAASLNPALLPTLEDRTSAYLAFGMELQQGQTTMQSNQRTLVTSDRNRILPALGAAWKLNDRWSAGLVFDTPFSRHSELPLEATSRFYGEKMDLEAQRIQAQAGFKVSDRFSLGFGLGMARLSYTYASRFRVQVPVDPTLPPDSSNPSQGLLETGVKEQGSGFSPSLSAGFRFAFNPRWTVGGSLQSPLRSKVKLSAGMDGRATSTYANDGYGPPQVGTDASAATVLGHLSALEGTGDLQLPLKAALGVRQRVNQLFTWEADLRYTGSKDFQTPGNAVLQAPGGTIASPQLAFNRKNAFGLGLMGELSLDKRWTVRGGASLEQGWTDDASVSPMFGGARTAAFSGGFGYRNWGGELLVGYQFRQSQDVDNPNLDGAWSRTGFRSTGSTVRVENMGHLLSIGFRRSF